jgi:nickel-dependent lactate racemase
VKKFLPLVGIAIIFIVVGYLESPYSVMNKSYATFSSIPYEVAISEESEPASIEENNDTNEETLETEEIAALNFSLEMVLESKSEVDDDIVETYREYEIYKDENGQVVKKVPTSKYEYLRYKK